MVGKLLLLIAKSLSLTLAILFLCASEVNCWSQSSDQVDKPAVSREPPPLSKDGTLALDARLWLPDDKSNPKLVPGFSVGDFLEIVNGKFPRYSFEQVTVRATIHEHFAELVAQYNVKIHDSTNEQLLEIPLRLENCQLVEKVQFEGGGKQTLEISPTDRGYIWHLRTKQAEQYSLRLVARTVLVDEQDRQQLTLALPASPCLIEFEIPNDVKDLRLGQQGSGLIDIEQQESKKKAIIRSNGDVAISWRRGTALNRISPVEAHSFTRFEFDNPQSAWVVSSNFEIHRYHHDQNAPMIIRLPPGSRYLPSPQFQNAFSINETSHEKPSAAAEPVELLVRFWSPADQYRLSIQWEWRPPPGSPLQSPISIPGIMLPEADLHDGRVEISMPSFYSLDDQRIGEGTELENKRNEIGLDRTLYAFRFSRQPFSLNAKVGRETALASVRPTYLVIVDQSKLKLTAWLNCAFEPSQALELGLHLGDWSLATAEIVSGSSPVGSFETLGHAVQPDGSIQLSSFDNSEIGTANKRIQQLWRLTAYLPMKSTGNTIVQFAVPRIVRYRSDGGKPDVDHGTGAIMVAAASNVMLHWDEENSQGLLSDSLSPSQIELIGGELASRSAVYRFQAGGETTPKWQGQAEILPQQVAIEQRLNCQVELEHVALKQEMSLQIDHLPLSNLEFSASRSLQDLRVFINGQEYSIRSVPAVVPPAPSYDFQLLGVPDLIGKTSVLITGRYNLAKQPDFGAITTITVPIPLLKLPNISRNLSGEVSISSSRDLEISHDSSANDFVSTEQFDRELRFPLEFSLSKTRLPISVRRLKRVTYLPVQVERAWLQTAISGADRRDRFCASIRTDQTKLTVNIPGANPQIFVDGKPVSPFPIAVDKYQFDLPVKEGGDVYLLDIWTWPVGSISWIAPHNIDIPKIDGTDGINRFYWQLITPYISHLAIVPNGFMPEWHWAWNGFWWSRESKLGQPELEKWVGVANQPEIAATNNRYLLSSFGSAKSFQCWTVSRLVLWFPVGLISILLTVLTMSIRFLRSPLVLVTWVALFGGLAMVWPDLAILVGQTLIVSIGLVALVLITRAAVDTRVRRRSVFTSRPTSASDRGSERQPGSRPQSQNPSTTQARSPVPVDGGP